MSAEYKGQNPIDLAQQAEKDLNSNSAKQGHGASASTTESGIDESVTNKFPGSTVTVGSAASGAGDNREIPEFEGGDVDPVTGQMSKAKDFEGEGGPEDKARQHAEDAGGDDDVQGNVRQGGETRRP